MANDNKNAATKGANETAWSAFIVLGITFLVLTLTLDNWAFIGPAVAFFIVGLTGRARAGRTDRTDGSEGDRP